MRPHPALRALCLALLLALPATAADPGAQAFMQSRHAELTGLVKKGSGSNARQVEAVFDGLLDYDALAQGSLRDEWRSRSEAERKEFGDVLKRLVQRAYRKNLDRTASYEVAFQGEAPQAETVLVRTVARSRTDVREEPISIDYVLHRVGTAWRVEDIVTEGTSLVGNYHQQFNRIIKKSGFPELLRRMKAKLSSGDPA